MKKKECGWLTPKQVAEELNFNVRTVLELIRKKQLHATHLGRQYRIPREELERRKKSEEVSQQGAEK